MGSQHHFALWINSVTQNLADIAPSKVLRFCNFQGNFSVIASCKYYLENCKNWKLCLKRYQRVFELLSWFKVQNDAETPYTRFTFKFWKRRNFWRQQEFESGYADFHWNLEQIRGFWTFWGRTFWGVAGRNFCRKIRIELKFHWKKKISHLDPPINFVLKKSTSPPSNSRFWTALL